MSQGDFWKMFDGRSFWLGKTLAEEGQKKVIAADPAWKDQANVLLRNIFKLMPNGALFTSEALRNGLDARGMPEPHHVNAYSAVIGAFLRNLMADERVRQTGFEAATRPQAHGRMLRLYKKL